ncbi:signal transduction histidine-protein kinase ArlS [Geobacter sp. OR-1]|uniref:sensor histidine kinase n=1 Tax=Geobacter sp. OR-1 TaxID=1266765 RepID=UPI0005432976|nr:ATP-binding protein [Geobacter sp. OR-1]GAM11217.1 signal transduction histidine-protein kinase ArlS [Geobacter sp. OR-1]
MQLRRSIRFSLTLWYALTLAVIMLVFSSFVYLTIRAGIYKQIDRELNKIAEALASPTMEPFRRAAPSVFDQVLEDFFGTKINGKYVQLLEADGTVAAASKNLNNQRFLLSRSTYRKAVAGESIHETGQVNGLPDMRIVTIPVFNDQKLVRVVQVGAPFGDELETLDKLLVIFGISIPLGILLLSGGGWFLAGQALRPVDLLTRTAQRITAENLSQRLEVLNPDDEIGRLAETFNSTLARLEASFIRTRRFFVDISHELRTPLTIIRGETEVGLKWAKEPDDFKEILQSNLDEVKRMSDIVESLLDLSRAEEGGVHLEMQEIELGEFLQALIHDLNQQQKHLEQESRVLLESVASAWIMGDMRRLRQVFLNLLNNAVSYSPEGSTVRVELVAEAGRARVSVVDRGTGIPAEDIDHIFERFYRVDQSRNRRDGGAGLGLSLVKSLTEAHGGKVYVESNVGLGSTFTVDLPAIPAPAECPFIAS